MVEQLLGPVVPDGEDADRGSDVAWIAGEFDDGPGGCLHQQGVTVTLVGAQRVPEFFRGGSDRKPKRSSEFASRPVEASQPAGRKRALHGSRQRLS